MHPDRDPVYEEYLKEITHGLPWHTAQKLLESIEQDRKAKAEAIAKRLLGVKGKMRCPECQGDGGWCGRCLGEGEI